MITQLWKWCLWWSCMINGMGISDVGGHIIDPVTYTYNIELKEGYEYRMKLKL